MRYAHVSVFCDKSKAPYVAFKYLSDTECYVFSLASREIAGGTISVFMQSESDLIRLKNTVTEAYERYTRQRKGEQYGAPKGRV